MTKAKRIEILQDKLRCVNLSLRCMSDFRTPRGQSLLRKSNLIWRLLDALTN